MRPGISRINVRLRPWVCPSFEEQPNLAVLHKRHKRRGKHYARKDGGDEVR